MATLDPVDTDSNERDAAAPATGSGCAGTLGELLVEVFLGRGADHHGDVQEAADEFRDLFASFGILTDQNEAIIQSAALRVARRKRAIALSEIDLAPLLQKAA